MVVVIVVIMVVAMLVPVVGHLVVGVVTTTTAATTSMFSRVRLKRSPFQALKRLRAEMIIIAVAVVMITTSARISSVVSASILHDAALGTARSHVPVGKVIESVARIHARVVIFPLFVDIVLPRITNFV